MDNRNYMSMDGRNPYGSQGGYVVSSRRARRRDRAMRYERDMARDNRGSRRGDRAGNYSEVNRRSDYNYGMGYQNDRVNDYARQDMNGHYMQGSTYYPIEAMGTFNGYYNMPEQDYARGGRRDYGYDMRSDYARNGRRDYGYDDYGNEYEDFGSTLSKEELKTWCEKLKENLDDREKQLFSKEAINQRAKQTGRKMDGFGAEEVEVVTLMLLDDYKKTLGANVDLMVKIAFDWLDDKDAKIRGAEKLAVYYDEIVMGDDD